MTGHVTRIVLTGGGSGGHVVPLIAVARSLRSMAPDTDLRYIGGNGFTERFFEHEGIDMHIIMGGKLRRYFSIQNFIDVFRMAIGLIQAMIELFFYMPDVIFSKAGPGALPVVLAGAFYRIPILIHESDSIPGLTNRICAMFASRIGISFPASGEYFSDRKTALVGNPIRAELVKKPDPPEAAKTRFGFDPGEPLVLILGGSQGAQKLNDFVVDLLGELTERFQVLHQTGDKQFEEVKTESGVVLKDLDPGRAAKYKAFAFFDEAQYRDALSAASVIVSRAGSSAIFEIAALGKPSILVPLPSSAGDHQRKNALAFYNAGCCIYFEEGNMLPHLFVEQLAELTFNHDRAEKIKAACLTFAKPHAANALAAELMKLARIAPQP